MITTPHAMDVENPEGAKEAIKNFISTVWGVPLGIIVVCLALFLGFRHFTKKSTNASK
jgi:hypothetical protein